MPELSPKQLAIWLAIAAVVLFVGARALRGEGAGSIDVQRALGGPAATASARPGKARLHKPRLYVHVAGAVRRPGLYRLPAGVRVAEAVRRAGGATRAADLDRVNLAAEVADGQQILVPRRGESTAAGVAQGAAEGFDAGAASGDVGAPISLSTADAAALETIDGIGPVTAGKILAFRDREGYVDSIERLAEIPGIGPVTMEALRRALVP